MSGSSMTVSRQSLRRWAAIKRSLAQFETVVKSCDNMAKDLQFEAQQILNRLEQGKADTKTCNDEELSDLREKDQLLSEGMEEPLVARMRPSLDYIFRPSGTDVNSNLPELTESSSSDTLPDNSGNTEEQSSFSNNNKIFVSMSSIHSMIATEGESDAVLDSKGKSQHDGEVDADSLSNEDESADTNKTPIFSLPEDDEPTTCDKNLADCRHESNYSVSELLDSVPSELPSISARFPSPKSSSALLPNRRISEPKVLPSLMRLERDNNDDSTQKPLYQRSQSDVTQRLMEVNAGKGDGRTRKFSAVAKNVRNVLQFFKRRTSEANAPAPPIDVVVSWSQNFSTLLNDKYGLMLFRSFLLSEYSEENIEFWIACEEYKKLKARQYPQKAQAIYSDFITVHAPKEVNLDSKTRMETMKALANPTKVTFDLAQSRIQCLMEKDSYTRFLKSPAYTSVLTQARSSAAASE